MKYVKAFSPIVSGICAILFAISWYEGTMFPAWVPLVWVWFVFVNDLQDYFKSK